jgi:hypothetical protein
MAEPNAFDLLQGISTSQIRSSFAMDPTPPDPALARLAEEVKLSWTIQLSGKNIFYEVSTP